MAIYSIVWSEKKQTSTGKWKIEAEIKALGATESIKGVTIWESFPGFATIMTGNNIEGDIVTKVNGQYTNVTLYPPKVSGVPGRSFTPKKPISESVAVAQENKARQIAQAQDRSAWMWAKNNASELLSGVLSHDLTHEERAEEVLKLATKIYNGEPTEPFN